MESWQQKGAGISVSSVAEYCTSVAGQEPTVPSGPEKHAPCWCDFQVTEMSSVLRYLICFQQLRQNELNHLLELKETEYLAFSCFILITAHLEFGRTDLRPNLQSDLDFLSPTLHNTLFNFCYPIHIEDGLCPLSQCG